MTSFKQLGLSNEILRVLSELGFEKPTEIQEQAIPLLLFGDTDLIGLAQTGTGKTAAFALPLLEQIDPSERYTQGLILAPTRELGRQIAEQIQIFSKYLDRVNVLAVYGGAPIVTQIKKLKQPQHIIIATPGRLIDLIKRRAVRLEQLRFLVLDEADEMMNMGFKEEVDTILEYTPEHKSTWLFSATMPPPIKKVVKKYMDSPAEVRVNQKNEVNVNIEHLFANVRPRDKREALTRFLEIDDNMRGVVFCRTKRETQDLAESLLVKGFKADALHGDLSQPQRDRVMRRFKEHELQVLIATDVAARGIDVNDLTHVFHFSLPDDLSYYTHRSGRTARAGKKGISIAFVDGREGYRIRRLEKDLGIKFKQTRIPHIDNVLIKKVDNWCRTILEKEGSKKLDRKLVDRANLLFAELTKEELVAKLLSIELKRMNLANARDLNDDGPAARQGGSSQRNRRKPRRDYKKPKNFKNKRRSFPKKSKSKSK